LKNIYGPVNSRRLGRSLGISIVPKKVCSFDCIYCELGPETNKCSKPDFYTTDVQILEELEYFFKTFNSRIDYLTITGYGEPTLNRNINKIAAAVKKKYPQYKLCLLTNSSFLDTEESIDSYKYFDVIIPSFDAASEEVFKKIDKPFDGISAEKIFQNIKILSKNFTGRIELEILFCKGINDTENEIKLLFEKAKDIMPDKIWINTVVRNPAYKFAEPISPEKVWELEQLFCPASKECSSDYRRSDYRRGCVQPF
jgi:wyosine [tRNA(Phe)-imidazoG37] synthetase (radical SAM superfamily)